MEVPAVYLQGSRASDAGKRTAVTDPQIAAEILNQALPYIQRYHGHTFVVKYGGSAMSDPETIRGVIRNVLLMRLVGISVVLVHGGGKEIDRWLQRLGIEKRTIQGLRVTDDATMEVVEMALAGRANKLLVSEIQQAGGRAVGLSGRDGGLLVGEPISSDLGRVGRIVRVDPDVVSMALERGYVPVVCSVASDAEGGALNVNADTAAAAIAGALKATKLILMTDTDGVLEDKNDPSTLISHLSREAAAEMIASGKADKGMIPKLKACLSALDSGVGRVHLIHGGVPNALLVEVFTDAGIGTMVG
ncbi:MAG: acetylglutamate kinase [Fimbriimonadales bacterium]|nr:acetylglutamate kinase [Fimbriimonadales bacterium]